MTCADAQRLLAAGYTHFADLDYLACRRTFFPRTRPHLSLDLHVLSDHDEHRLASLIESTYVDTLDCIDLDGVRTMADTITGYRMTGRYRPAWWLIARQGDIDVGCLIMADHEANDQCELVYMGIVPEARGHGYGQQLVKHALWLAASQERERLVLAVDRRNWPARDIYTQCGFQTWATRSIMIKRFGS